MAKQKRRYGNMRSTLAREDKHRIINDYIAATGADEIDMNDVARWAQANGRMPPPRPFDPVKMFAHELSEAAREEYYIDPQGREVRKKHVYTIVEADGTRRWHWVDIVTAKPEPMHKSLQSRRRQALGDVVQLDTDRRSYNENNLFGGSIDMSYNFDEDLAELQMPTEYPEGGEGEADGERPEGNEPPTDAPEA
jgi:hypothetical protein